MDDHQHLHQHLHQHGGKHLVQTSYTLYNYPSDLCSTRRQPQQRHQPDRGALCGGVSDVKFEVPEMCVRWPRLVKQHIVKAMEKCRACSWLKLKDYERLNWQKNTGVLPNVAQGYSRCIDCCATSGISSVRTIEIILTNLRSRTTKRWQVIARTPPALCVGAAPAKELRSFCCARNALGLAFRCAATAPCPEHDVIFAMEPRSQSIRSTPSFGWP